MFEQTGNTNRIIYFLPLVLVSENQAKWPFRHETAQGNKVYPFQSHISSMFLNHQKYRLLISVIRSYIRIACRAMLQR